MFLFLQEADAVLRERHPLEKNESDLGIRRYDIIKHHYSAINLSLYHFYLIFLTFLCFMLLCVTWVNIKLLKIISVG